MRVCILNETVSLIRKYDSVFFIRGQLKASEIQPISIISTLAISMMSNPPHYDTLLTGHSVPSSSHLLVQMHRQLSRHLQDREDKW